MLRYCRPYPAQDLRRFGALSRWLEETGTEPPDGYLYLWDDLRVTADPLADQPAFTVDSAEWRAFCTTELGFAVPADLVASTG